MENIQIPFATFADDRTYRLVEEMIFCPRCHVPCDCEGYNEQELIYRCPHCHDTVSDTLDIEPLFAMNSLEAATMRHYEIACPYCGQRAPLVGGSSHKGLFFACERNCHREFTRFIRRY